MSEQELKNIFESAGIPDDELEEMLDAYNDPNTARHHEAKEIVHSHVPAQ